MYHFYMMKYYSVIAQNIGIDNNASIWTNLSIMLKEVKCEVLPMVSFFFTYNF